MLVLGIETSCDETAVALLRLEASGRAEILAEEISSQTDIHEAYGGVVPELASRAHLYNLPLLYDKVLSDSRTKIGDIDCIGVTSGPGLKGCLLMGLGFAKGLALSSGAPLVAVNHIEGHILAPLLDNAELEFPYLCLVVSGGHTEIHIVRGVGEYQLISRTIDDAAGEAFDKSANLLGFSYPGGAKLAALADSTAGSDFELPRVMKESSAFSFSGLKTAISLLIKKHQPELETNEDLRGQLAHGIQRSIVDALIVKLKAAVEATGIKQIAVTGGVSANKLLRSEVSALEGATVYLPEFTHCMDNAAMIAYAAGLRFIKGERSNESVSAVARWPVETCEAPQ